MNKSMPVFLAVFIAGCLMPPAIHAQSSDTSQPDVNSAIESLRADLRADKVDIIKNTMQFTPQESTAFWPVYNRYAADMQKVNDNRVALVKGYAAKFDTLNDADAKDMVTRMLSFEQRRLDVKKKYFKEFSSKLSGQTVARFFQLEHRFDLVVDTEIASRLPALLERSANQ